MLLWLQENLSTILISAGLLLVVIAIIAITVFRPKLQELWDSIADGINAL